jgi:ketosteroid isomerase-like protein
MRASVPSFVLAVLAAVNGQVQPPTPVEVVTELLNADRAFSKGGSALPPADAIARMFADDVIMPAPGNRFVEGREKAIEALRANPDNLSGRVEWTPIRGGISGDGRHGFTFGYMTLRRADGSTPSFKYLSYWIRQASGWRVAAYKRGPRPALPFSAEAMPPALPVRISTDPGPSASTVIRSLIDNESAFSALAQRVGIGGAFSHFGSSDAVNMGAATDAAFLVGAPTIGQSVGTGVAPGKSPVSWSAERALAASSGDLGITFGRIRSNDPGKAGDPGFPFFTIWRRASPADSWRYIAE